MLLRGILDLDRFGRRKRPAAYRRCDQVRRRTTRTVAKRRDPAHFAQALRRLRGIGPRAGQDGRVIPAASSIQAVRGRGRFLRKESVSCATPRVVLLRIS